ncbi:hypothetical protein [uncultured Clostridium sp.]|uniref:hypothetical protein n=1 Tax=uncultured Clostridium sp. TaxID=59620 RepID=UPI0025DE3EA9|nr:hypothetical protein [uncultured Clostridium sp.]
MRYIGPFFRMNSLSQDEISGQLFYLAKESVKTLVLNSKCGLLAPIRSSKKSSINDISILNNFSPLLCMYRKASPLFIHSKTSHGFDESSFKKEINPASNALMTLCILELSEYYSYYNTQNRNVDSLEGAYRYIAKEQLKFYSENLRNSEGLFVTKKNTSDGNSKGFNLIDKDDKFKFSDQAFMMDAYLIYAKYNPSDEISPDYLKFSKEILNLFIDYKDALYELSFSENVEIFLCINAYYKYSHDADAKKLILDLGDYLITKFQEKDYYIDSLDDCALFSMCLMDAYKHTGIISFKDCYTEINDRLIGMYNSEKNMFMKISDKKEVKYSSTEINSYILSLLLYSKIEDKDIELKSVISGVYRKCFVNNGLLASWPDAPTLDEVERYRNLSLRADDMLDETYFRMPTLPTPKSSGIAPVFLKNLTYSKKKDVLSSSKLSFDSNKNMFNFYLIIYFLKDSAKKFMGFIAKDSNSKHNSDIEKIDKNYKRLSIDDSDFIDSEQNSDKTLNAEVMKDEKTDKFLDISIVEKENIKSDDSSAPKIINTKPEKIEKGTLEPTNKKSISLTNSNVPSNQPDKNKKSKKR